MNVLISFIFWLFCLMKCGCNNILFITDVSIQKYESSTNISAPISNKPLNYVNDIAYDYELQNVYYVIDSVHLYSISMITKERKLLMSSNNEILRIVVDWVTKKIYYTIATRNRVVVIDNTGSMKKVLFQRKMASLNAICLSPKNGLLFFSDMGDNAKIERANMDGTDNMILVNAAIQMPTTLTVDPNENKIYWADVMKETVEMINMDGTNRKVLLNIPNGIWGTISSLAVFPHQVFMSSSGNADTNIRSGIFSCNKTSDDLLENCSKEIAGRLFYSSVKAFGNEYQRKINSKCRYKNGGCSHLCLLTPNGQGFSCGCPTGYDLLKDNKTCSSSFKKFIVFATRPDLRVVSLDVKNKVDLILPVKVIQTVKAVDYDPVDKMLYWTDATSINYGVIMRASLNGSIKEEVVPQGYTSPDHLAIDWVARNLYWTCPRYHKIYISRLNGSSNMVVIDKNLEEPRGIAVDPGDGRLYWSDWGTTNPKIESSDLDGSNRIVLINESLRWPNGVALDYTRRQLYWVDAGTDLIEYYDLTEGRRYKLEYASPHAYGISVLDDMLYWTDWQQRALFQLNLVKRKVEKIVYNVHDIMGMKAVDAKYHLKYGNNECGRINFGCSHFCFHKPNQGAYCACPPGHYLSLQNGKDCIAVAGYLLYATWSSINMLSINPNKNSPTPKILDKDIALITTISKKKRVFWVQDSVERPAAIAIKSASLNHTKSKHIVLTGFSGHVGGITIDWLSENIYWSQSKPPRIEVSKLDGSYKRIVVNVSDAKIGKVVVDPIKGKLYWIQTKDNIIHSVVRANLDGSVPFILANLTDTPFGLTLDINDSRIYWLTEKYIGSVLWNGQSNRTMYVEMSHPSSMVLFQDYLFVCEWENPNHVALTISSIHKDTGKKRLINHMQTSWCGDISVFHSALQQGDNLCSEDNGRCQQLCFPTNLTTRRCGCESHFTLDPSDNSTCHAPTSFFLISQKDNVLRYSPTEETNVALNLKTPDLNLAMTRYNIMTSKLYWLDVSKNQIFYLSHQNLPQVLDLCKEDARPTSFTIDFFSNTIYWTDSSDSSISFLRLSQPDTAKKCGVIFKSLNYQPTKIASMPERGQLVFIKKKSSVIQEKANFHNTLQSIRMDGSDERQLHQFVDDAEYDISIDEIKERVYWIHLTEVVIQSVSLDGKNARKFLKLNKETVKPLAFTIHGGRFYWIDKQQEFNPVEYLKWRSLVVSEPQIHTVNWEYESTKDLEAVEMIRANEKHPCNFQNGGCSHVCYTISMLPMRRRCGCPMGYGYKENDDTQCEKLNNKTCAYTCNGFCKPMNVMCRELSSCYEKHQTCFGCKQDGYKCLSGHCVIPQSKYCDGQADCLEGIDEDEEKCKEHHIKTTLITSTSQTSKYYVQSATHGYSEYTAGIISGAIFTAIVFACVFYVACRLRQKKAASNVKKESVELRQAASFNISPQIKESIFVVPQKRTDDADSAYTDSYVSSNDLAHLPRHNNESLQTFGMRYITGSSTNVTDSTMALPFNPPPTIASSDAVSLSSLNGYSQLAGIAMSDISEMTTDFLPAPPATPLYCPSDMESVMLTDLDSVSRKGCQSENICHDCARHQQNSDYKRRARANSHTCCCDESASISTVTTYPNERRLPSCSNCSNVGYVTVGRHKAPASYHPPSLVSQDSSYSSRTLPRYRQSSSRPLVPSLASGVSRCSSETSIVTVRHKDDLPTYVVQGNDNDDYYTDHRPALCSLSKFPPEMNNFEDFKDEEDEALENDLLLESHRPPPGVVE